MKRLWHVAGVDFAGLLLVVYLFASGTLFAQGVSTGSIQGAITDTSGSFVPGVKVTVTNTLTNASQTITTGPDGSYSVPNLAISTYRVTAEKEGFKKEIRYNIQVNVGQASVIDIQMAVGSVSSSVTVRAQSIPITENKGDRAVILPAETIEELPLEVAGSQRLDDSFLTLSPGVTGSTFTARINGGPDQSQDFYYDGIPYMNADGGGRQEGNGPPVDAVAEYAIDTNAYSAQYGRGTGLLNFSIKSGTNQLHGGAWEYMRNNALDARGFFAPTVGTEKQNEFGGMVGGPVIIPKVYNGKDKTFFFFLMDGFRFRGGLSTSLITLPTKQMLAGDFSQLPFPIYDPSTTRPDGHGGLTRDPFPGNIIPMSRLSALSKPYLDLMPTATLPGVFNNAVASVPTAPINNNNVTAKVDHYIRPGLVLHASYYQWGIVEPTSPIIPGPLGTGNNFFVHSWEPRLSLDQTLTPNVENQLLFSTQYTEGVRDFYPLVPSGFSSPLATPGLPYPGIAISGMPGFGVGLNNNQNSGGCWPCIYLADNLKWMKGKHSLSFGTEIRAEDERDAFAQNIGQYSFGNGTTSLPDSPNFGTLGYGLASFFLGTPSQASRTGFAPPRLAKTAYRAFYGQDDIHVNQRLTLNLGLRWDYSVPVNDPPHNLFSTFDPTVPNPGAGGRLGSLVFAGTSGGPCIAQGGASLCRNVIANTYYGMWQPRVGFAYRLGDKTVVRGGFGKSSIRGGATTLMGPSVAASFLTGFQFQSVLQTPDNGISPPVQLQPTWDVGIPPIGPAPARTRSLANGQNIDFMQNVDGTNGYIMDWNLTVERELPWQVVLETSYVGSSAVGIGANLLNENQVPAADLSLGSLLYADINSPAAQAAGIRLPYAGFTGTVAQGLRPFPQYLAINANTQADGHATYHSLQMRGQRYFSDGVTFLVSFTWFKNLSNARSQFSPFYGPPLDTANQSLEKANENGPGSTGPMDLSIAQVYDLPVGPGKKYLNTGGPVGKVIGGWSLSSILTYDNGAYLSMGGGTPNPIFNSAYGDAFFGGGAPRPNRVPGVNPKSFQGGNFNPAVNYYLNPAAFSDAGAFALGNAPPVLPDVRGFPYLDEDLALIKQVQITESTSLQFRAEFFNAFNRVVFGGPDTNYSDVATGAFGKVGGQGNSPRQIQLALRFTF
ncbi:MAG TPA: carboxypeptidase-like regulatory domain-containing protein [Terriglobia bacterium]|nr:carboxypeptidase-like regulatory domain-containing protein [Terriglobia bacterium]